MTAMKKDHQVTGNVGLYWVCYHLSKLGWNAMPTARNARGVDIIAYNRGCSLKLAIQVKTLSKKSPVPLGTSLNGVGDFWIIVNEVATSPCAYILLPVEVRDLAHRGEKDGRVSYWLQPSSYCVPKYREAWQRLGDPGLGGD
jgi:hypothetical protein